MKNARLTHITIENLKSFSKATKIPFKPLTIIIGRNNSGKSTLIQSLLLLKQTLSDPRQHIKLKLDGMVEAFSLRELTFGWPEEASEVKGPTIILEWLCEVDVVAALNKALNPDLENLAKYSGVAWLVSPPDMLLIHSKLKIHTLERKGSAQISALELGIKIKSQKDTHTLRITSKGRSWSCEWNGQKAQKMDVEFDHFIPYLSIDRKKVGPRLKERAWHNAYLVLFEQPLEALKNLLLDMHYLGSHRTPPPSLFRPATTDPEDIGASGEFAAQMLHRQQNEIVHFLPPIQLLDDRIQFQKKIHALPMIEAVNQVMNALSITPSLRVKDIQDVGFQLKFGEANLVHVGRGLSSLLPLVQLGLFADPIRFSGDLDTMSLTDYLEQCASISHIVLEEPEAHLHPKAASRLAHFFVSLAMANRRLMIETHSDHLVRRLRGLAARAERGSTLEKWFKDNVVVLSVSQDEHGCSSVAESRLTAGGDIEEIWPTDFMDEATDEESAIYYAKLDKTEEFPDGEGASVMMVDGDEPESDVAP